MGTNVRCTICNVVIQDRRHEADEDSCSFHHNLYLCANAFAELIFGIRWFMPKQTSVVADTARNIQDNLDFIFIIRYRNRMKKKHPVSHVTRITFWALVHHVKRRFLCKQQRDRILFDGQCYCHCHSMGSDVSKMVSESTYILHNGSNHSDDKPKYANAALNDVAATVEKHNAVKKI